MCLPFLLPGVSKWALPAFWNLGSNLRCAWVREEESWLPAGAGKTEGLKLVNAQP